MHDTRRLWRWLAIICFFSFAALGWVGTEIYQAAPPIPQSVVTESGKVLYTKPQIQQGQQAWLSAGGQQVGSVWGHGSYLAPDWSADWLHREALALRERLAQQFYAQTFAELSLGKQAEIAALLTNEMRQNRYDAATDTLTVSDLRADAINEVAAHYYGLFGNDPALNTLREQYAMMHDSLHNDDDRQALTGFFFWSAWSATTNRPGETHLTYTNNWPHEPLVDNTPSASVGIWSIASVILLIAGIGAMAFFHSKQKEATDPTPPTSDPLFNMKPTASMRATVKYFYVVIGLILAQVGMGILTAHYAVEGHSLFGIPLVDLLPYSISRTIHTQFAVFWIATAWLATGLYISPILSGHEPKFQKLGVDLLFWALIFVVVGSTLFGWLGTLQQKGLDFSFWFGSQGLEFTTMGRFWQILLFVGLMFWLFLMGRALLPALKIPSESRGLIAMVFLSATCIGLFYASSLMWGRHTHYAMIEYWRWWLVHLWVEGFFEVFATAVIALLFTRLGLIRSVTADHGDY